MNEVQTMQQKKEPTLTEGFKSLWKRVKLLYPPNFIKYQRDLLEGEEAKWKKRVGYLEDQITNLVRKSNERKMNPLGEFFSDDGFAGGSGLAQYSYAEAILSEEAFKREGSWISRTSRAILQEQGLKLEPTGKKKEDQRIREIEEAFRRSLAGFWGMGGSFLLSPHFSQRQTMAIQAACRLRYNTDPHAESVVESLKSYAIGRGITFKVAAPEIQTFLEKDYWEFNSMSQRHKDRFADLIIDGEVFNIYRRLPVGGRGEFRMLILTVSPDQITDIELREDEFPMAYKRSFRELKGTVLGEEKEFWIPDINKESYVRHYGFDDTDEDMTIHLQDVEGEVEEQAIHHMKVGNGMRGRPYLSTTLRPLKMYEDFEMDVVRLHHEQSKVVWIEWLGSGTPDITNNTYRPAPDGGIILQAIKGQIEYEFKTPEVEAAPIEAIGELLRLTLAAGWRTPQFIAFSNASDAVYASVKKMENPYTNLIIDWEDMYEEMLNIEARYFIKHAVEAERLPEKVKVMVIDEDAFRRADDIVFEALTNMGKGKKVVAEQIVDLIENELEPKLVEVSTVDVKIDWEFPNVINDDELRRAQALKIHKEIGVDMQTLITKAGYDWRTVLARKIREQQRNKELGIQVEGGADKNKPGYNPQLPVAAE